jgi:integrase
MWRLTVHLIPWFGKMPLDAITFEEVERYIAAELAEGERIREAAANGEPIIEGIIDKHGCERKRKARPLSPRSINMTVTLLGAILERAVKRKLIDGNPAKDKDLRVKEREPARSYLDTAAQIEALLNAAGELDREATKERRHIERRAMLATLTFAGLRINELCALRWRDVDLVAGWLHTGSKTDAGRYRAVKIRGALGNELVALRARCGSIEQDAYVFATRTGKPMADSNLRRRTLGHPAVAADGEKGKAGKGAVGRANANLAARGLPPLPERITPHSLRRTFCSLLYALGEPPTVVMDEMGHTDPGLALRVYAQAMRRGEDETAQLRALVEGVVMANSGQRDENEAATYLDRRAA